MLIVLFSLFKNFLNSSEKIVIDSLTKIAADYHYASPVRTKAMKVLKSLNDSSSSSSEKK